MFMAGNIGKEFAGVNTIFVDAIRNPYYIGITQQEQTAMPATPTPRTAADAKHTPLEAELLAALGKIAELNDAKIEEASEFVVFSLLRIKVDIARAALSRAGDVS